MRDAPTLDDAHETKESSDSARGFVWRREVNCPEELALERIARFQLRHGCQLLLILFVEHRAVDGELPASRDCQPAAIANRGRHLRLLSRTEHAILLAKALQLSEGHGYDRVRVDRRLFLVTVGIRSCDRHRAGLACTPGVASAPSYAGPSA